MNILDQSIRLVGQAETAELGWYQQPTFLGLAGLFLSIVVAILLGRFLAGRFRMPEMGWKISLVASCLLVSAVVFSVKSYETRLKTEGRAWVPFKFGVDLRGGVTIIGQLKEQTGDDKVTIQELIPQLKQRIDPGGVREIVIRALGTEKMEVIIPDVEREEAERIWHRLATAGHLLFRIVADDRKQINVCTAARETAHLREFEVRGAPSDEQPDGELLGHWYALARIQPEPNENQNVLKPFKYLPETNNVVRNAQTGELIQVEDIPTDSNSIDRSRELFWAWCKDNGIEDVEILMLHPSRERQDVEGKHLQSVSSGFDQQANLRIEFRMTGDGGKRLRSLTSAFKPDANGRKSKLGIVLDEQLQAAPNINEPISTNGVIEGSFTQEEIDSYVAVLKSGKLDVTLRKNWISMDQILSELGEELKRKGVFAISFSLILVLVFMVIYYRFCGVVACLALALNLIFTMSILLLINASLTLTGLAGLVLTVGMSVDANVLIFERIREELTRGTALRMAIRNGFDRASTTIIDANLTTLITAVILYVIGTEQIRGFSVTLIVGILMCMFTSIFCSRILFDIAERRRWITKLNMSQIIGSTLLDFIGKRRVAFAVSLLVIVVGLIGFYSRGAAIFDTDLAGGSTARIVFNESANGITTNDIRDDLEKANYEHLGEPIRYTVTQMRDNELAFKIDSSLPVIEDPVGEPLKLDDIIAEVFKGRLSMLAMDYDPNDLQITQVARTGSPDAAQEKKGQDNGAEAGPGTDAGGFGNDPGNNLDNGNGDGNEPENDELGFSYEHVQFVSTMAPQDPTQDTGETAKQKEAAKQEAKPKPSENTEQVEKSKPDDDATKNENSGQGDKVQEAGPQTPVTAEKDDQQTQPSQAETPQPRAKYTATVPLSFAYNITGESVQGALLAAARELQIPLRDRDIVISSPEGVSEGDSAKQWGVTLTVFGDNDAQRILAQMEETMEQEPYFASSSGVGGQIAGETQIKALTAMIASLLGIVAYVWIRFQNVAFGLAAIAALVHDVLVVLGAIAISAYLSGTLGFLLIQDFRISLSVVAALLTIIGYSLNDTIVVFDRIREVRGRRSDLTAEIVNKSISQTLSRTILTSLTTLIVVSILFVFGGDSIHAFAYALVIGVIVGTYSSIFVASPVLLWLMNRHGFAGPPEVKTGAGT